MNANKQVHAHQQPCNFMPCTKVTISIIEIKLNYYLINLIIHAKALSLKLMFVIIMLDKVLSRVLKTAKFLWAHFQSKI